MPEAAHIDTLRLGEGLFAVDVKLELYVARLVGQREVVEPDGVAPRLFDVELDVKAALGVFPHQDCAGLALVAVDDLEVFGGVRAGVGFGLGVGLRLGRFRLGGRFGFRVGFGVCIRVKIGRLGRLAGYRLVVLGLEIDIHGELGSRKVRGDGVGVDELGFGMSFEVIVVSRACGADHSQVVAAVACSRGACLALRCGFTGGTAPRARALRGVAGAERYHHRREQQRR